MLAHPVGDGEPELADMPDGSSRPDVKLRTHALGGVSIAGKRLGVRRDGPTRDGIGQEYNLSAKHSRLVDFRIQLLVKIVAVVLQPLDLHLKEEDFIL